MDESKKVSIIMGFYNEKKYLAHAIQSVLESTYENLELILVNDGSNDDSEEIVKNFSDDRIIYIKSDENFGLAHARNLGLGRATGDYIGFFDGDDVLDSLKIQYQVEFLNKHQDILIVGGGFDFIDAEGERASELGNHIYPFSSDLQIRACMLFNNCVAGGGALFRRSLIDQHNVRFDENLRLSQDYKFWIDCIQFGRVHNLDIVLYHYRYNYGSHASRLQTSKPEKYNRTMIDILEYAWKTRGFLLDRKDIEFIYYHANLGLPLCKISEYIKQKKLENRIRTQLEKLNLAEGDLIIEYYQMWFSRAWIYMKWINWIKRMCSMQWLVRRMQKWS